MHVSYTRRFQDEFDALPSARQQATVEAIQDFLQRVASQQPMGAGLGLKKYGKDYWEIRSTLSDRILFEWGNDEVIFRFVGSHDELRKFVRGN